MTKSKYFNLFITLMLFIFLFIFLSGCSRSSDNSGHESQPISDFSAETQVTETVKEITQQTTTVTQGSTAESTGPEETSKTSDGSQIENPDIMQFKDESVEI